MSPYSDKHSRIGCKQVFWSIKFNFSDFSIYAPTNFGRASVAILVSIPSLLIIAITNKTIGYTFLIYLPKAIAYVVKLYATLAKNEGQSTTNLFSLSSITKFT